MRAEQQEAELAVPEDVPRSEAGKKGDKCQSKGCPQAGDTNGEETKAVVHVRVRVQVTN